MLVTASVAHSEAERLSHVWLKAGYGLAKLVTTVTVVIGTSCAGFAQNPNGVLQGVVRDASGGRIASASVLVHGIGSSVERTLTTGKRGDFRFDGLMPGSYRVVVNAGGFSEATSNVDINVSIVQDLLVTLWPAVFRQTVDIQGKESSYNYSTPRHCKRHP